MMARVREDLEARLKTFQLYEAGATNLAHINEGSLRGLYAAILWDPEGVLDVGAALLETTVDRLAVLQAMSQAALGLAADEDEHRPKAGLSAVWMETKKKLDRDIAALRSKGEKSDIFARWEAAQR